jgi:hypothetical protein
MYIDRPVDPAGREADLVVEEMGRGVELDVPGAPRRGANGAAFRADVHRAALPAVRRGW